ncbi:mitochondrial ribosome small subunit component [Scheffersomyces amazonensis]|uniref:mitochondrial ribosome small subunit component n=1 Tax=Scheffersomyces amazonensis TaxID=1078765 RepID=UPI00315DCFBD
MTVNSHELYNLIKNSKFAQVASPLSKKIRGSANPTPTHQIIFTPKTNAARSDYGLKTTLPKKIGFSHISFNDIDNYKNMPDVEKSSSKLYTRLTFQESGLAVNHNYTSTNPLFPNEENKSNYKAERDNIVNSLNLHSAASVNEVLNVLNSNKKLHQKYQQWLIKNYPQALITNITQTTARELLSKFLNSSPDIKRKEVSLQDLSNKLGKVTKSAISSKIQGSGGFSYMQKGRLNNTPNGIKYGTIAPGRIVDTKEAAIGGFVAGINERTTNLQVNYASNAPGKHLRQFVMPFKINSVEFNENGSVKVFADGVKAGTWMYGNNGPENQSRNKYKANNPNFQNAAARSKQDNEMLTTLLNIVF